MKLYFKAKQRVKSGVISHFGQHPWNVPCYWPAGRHRGRWQGAPQCHMSFICSPCFPKKVAAVAS